MKLLGALILSALAAFDTRVIPIDDLDTGLTLVPAQGGAVRDVLVVQGRTLRAHPLSGTAEPRQVELPKTVTAFDVGDIDNDRVPEVVAVAGKQILRIPFGSGAPSTLFEHEGMLSQDRDLSYLHPLLVATPDRMLVALPEEKVLALFTPAGERVSEVPLWTADAPFPPEDFRAYAADRNLDNGNKSLEWSVWRRMDLSPELPRDMRFAGTAMRVPMPERCIYAQERKGVPPLDWPWFPVRETETEDLSAHFARPSFLSQETIVCVIAIGVPLQDELALPRYPGILVSTWRPPDFNGDGYNDLVLLRLREPGGSIGNIVRTATHGTLPIELGVHLYQADRGRFDPRPAGRIECRSNVGNVFARDPVDAVVMSDLNGDGHSDLGFSPSPREYVIWLWKDQGFSKEPDYSRTFDEPLHPRAYAEDLGGKGRYSIGLSSDEALYVVSFRTTPE